MTVSTKESWRTRKTDLKKGISELKKQYVKSELMNYHYYKECWEKLEQKRVTLNQKYEDRLEREGSGSVIKLPDGSTSKSPWQIEKTGEIADLLDHMALYEHNLRVIDEWLDCLTLEQKSAVFAYVIDRQCSDLEGAATELTGKTSDAVNKAQERAIKKIIAINF